MNHLTKRADTVAALLANVFIGVVLGVSVSLAGGPLWGAVGFGCTVAAAYTTADLIFFKLSAGRDA